MLNEDKATQPLVGIQLLSLTLGELDADQQKKLEEKCESSPELKGELEEIRQHLALHQQVRKVAPRRGSYHRLRQRMKNEGATDGAIPGVHAMLRRAFMLAIGVGLIAILLLIAFGSGAQTFAAPDVIGQIVFHNPSLSVGQRRAEVDRRELTLKGADDEPDNTSSYDAFIWLPTGVSNTYSTIEAAQNTEFKFTEPRRVTLLRGFLRQLQIQPGGIGEGPFVVETPHCNIHVDQGSLSIKVTRDGAETQITVGEGGARVFGLDSDRAFPVPAGFCTSVGRGQLPDPARPVLKLILDKATGSRFVVRARLINDGYVPVKIRRAIDKASAFAEPVYILHISHVAEYEPGEGLPENVSLPPWPVLPEPDPSQDHTGEKWLEPQDYYEFTFDISSLLLGTPRVEHWLRLEYRGDLYGPPGEAKVRIQSANLKLDLRNR